MNEQLLGREKMNKKIKAILCTISPTFTTRLMYLFNFQKPLHLKNPRNINEKLQNLKLGEYYDNGTITECVDKIRVREYLKRKGLERLSAKLIWGGMMMSKS